MRRTLMAAAASFAMVATMALPAGAAVVTAHPGGGGRGGSGYSHRGGDGGRAGEWRDDGRHDRDGDRHDGRTYYDYDPSYGYDGGPYSDDPYYGGDGECPGGGYYDANGTYWYWDPSADGYVACPGN
jgi:hypothetical protein